MARYTYRVRITKPDAVEVNPPDSDWLDISADVRGLAWRYGSRHANSLGHVSLPGSGTIVLKNTGDYYQFSPHPDFDVRPGAQVDIEVYNEIDFVVDRWRGWSTGLSSHEAVPQVRYLANGTPLGSVAVLTVQGGLGVLGLRYGQVYTQLPGVFTGEAVRLVLQDVNWPHGSVLGTGRSKFNDARVDQARLAFGQERQGKSVLVALEAIAQAELGRIYDDDEGRIIFEDRLKRMIVPAPALSINASHALEFNQRPIAGGVVNEVLTDATRYRSGGTSDIDYWDDARNMPPITIQYEAGTPAAPSVYQQTLYLDHDPDAGGVAYVTNVSISPEQFTIGEGADLQVFPSASGDVLVRISSSGPAGQATIIGVNAEAWRIDTNFRGRLLRRREESIRRFGLRSVTLPAKVLDNVNTDLIKYLDHALNTHSGDDLTALWRADIRGEARRYPELLGHGVSDVVRVSGLQGLNGDDFYIDEVFHRVRVGSSHEVTHRLSSTRAWARWVVGQSRIGQDTRLDIGADL